MARPLLSLVVRRALAAFQVRRPSVRVEISEVRLTPLAPSSWLVEFNLSATAAKAAAMAALLRARTVLSAGIRVARFVSAAPAARVKLAAAVVRDCATVATLPVESSLTASCVRGAAVAAAASARTLVTTRLEWSDTIVDSTADTLTDAGGDPLIFVCRTL